MTENKEDSEISRFELDFIAKVSHELKTPLASIYNVSELLLDNYKDQMSDDVLKFTKLIHRGAQRLTVLIHNLLDVSIIDSNKMKLNLQTINLVKIIKECAEDITFLAKKRNLILNMDLPDNEYLMVDKIKIEQVIMNLLSNAIKNTPPKGIILISFKKSKKYVEIQIKDTGIGFTKVEKENLFKKFGKIKRCVENMNIDAEGSGLGLYISKEIVNLHGGQIWMDSEGRNKGSIFYFTLPIINENKT